MACVCTFNMHIIYYHNDDEDVMLFFPVVFTTFYNILVMWCILKLLLPMLSALKSKVCIIEKLKQTLSLFLCSTWYVSCMIIVIIIKREIFLKFEHRPKSYISFLPSWYVLAFCYRFNSMQPIIQIISYYNSFFSFLKMFLTSRQRRGST